MDKGQYARLDGFWRSLYIYPGYVYCLSEPFMS